MNVWTWRLEAADGTVLAGAALPRPFFPSQADAETWLGENWRSLFGSGVEQVSLLEDGRVVYGSMSLRPLE